MNIVWLILGGILAGLVQQYYKWVAKLAGLFSPIGASFVCCSLYYACQSIREGSRPKLISL